MTKRFYSIYSPWFQTFTLIVTLLVSAFAGANTTHRNLKAASSASNGVSFENLKDGQEVQSSFKVIMKVQGKTIAVAGEKIDDPTHGHHHILVNADSIPQGQPIPTDETHLHFGKGQTEAELKLTKGKHKLTLQLADGAHRSFGPAWSKTITVIVK